MLPEWYNEYKKLIDDSINNYLIEYFKDEKNKWLELIKKASLYSVKGWKRIRSILALEFYLIFSWRDFKDIKENDDIIKFCISLELLHSYSLVHDDLPVMDNDEYRRWQLTTWKKYWETNAVLVWDLLNSLSFEVLSGIKNIWNHSILISYFGQAVWIKWMIWGQVLDLYYENNPKKLTLDNLIEVHNKKTWALIEVSVLWWIIIAEENLHFAKDTKNNNTKRFLDFWQKIGLAFQIKDDLLDVEWTLQETGKSVWDEEKKWFVFFLWLDKARAYLNNLIKECHKNISELNSKKLEFLVEYIWNRKK